MGVPIEIGGPYMVMVERDGVTFAPLKHAAPGAARAAARAYELQGFRVWVLRSEAAHWIDASGELESAPPSSSA